MAGSKHILIVEDDQFIAEMYAKGLAKAGLKVDMALDGNQALKTAESNHYDLILLDIMMPGMTGIDVLHKLRADKRFDQTKIVILTNLAQDDASKEALSAKADGYIIKADVVPSQLAKMVKELID